MLETTVVVVACVLWSIYYLNRAMGWRCGMCRGRCKDAPLDGLNICRECMGSLLAEARCQLESRESEEMSVGRAHQGGGLSHARGIRLA